ncbi:MAG: hypothetical protein KC493_01625 [Bacteriovoracaceae bacterium]|nr:hypothetical protein [Bacteriovoracaceae bacterium]
MKNSTILNTTLIIFIFITTSCSASKTKLSKDAERITLLLESVPVHCKELKKVMGVNMENRVDLAQIHAMNLATLAGGDGISFDKQVMAEGKWKVYATAYKCKAEN